MANKKDKAEDRYARLVRVGEKVRVKIPPSNEDVEEVVRNVSVVLHLANGADVVLPGDGEVQIVPDTFTEDLKAQADGLEQGS